MARTMYLCALVAALFIISFIPASAAQQTLVLSLEAPNLDGAGPSASDSPSANTKADTDTAKAADSTKQKPSSNSNSVKVGQVGLVQSASASIYRTMSSRGKKYSTVKAETPLAVVKDSGDWYGVLMSNGKLGWIQKNSVKLIGYELIAKRSAISRGGSASRGGFISRLGEIASDVIRTAEQYYGVRYVFGGTNPSTGMDCSAFVRSVFGRHGINLPRTAREQAEVGQSVPFDQLQPGDRLYFSCKNPYIDHCGIYAGNGLFIHCSASRKGVGVDNLSSGFYSRCLVTAKRS